MNIQDNFDDAESVIVKAMDISSKFNKFEDKTNNILVPERKVWSILSLEHLLKLAQIVQNLLWFK